MTKNDQTIRPYPGHWYLLTPALAEPLEVAPVDWLGPSWDLLKEWAHSTSEAVQDAQLKALWAGTCRWAEQAHVNEITIEGSSRLSGRDFAALGFTRQSVFSWRSFPFPVSDEWRLSGDSASTVAVLEGLHDRGGFSLVARASGVERLRLRDNSWDAVYLNVADTDSDEAAARMATILRQARSAEGTSNRWGQ